MSPARGDQAEAGDEGSTSGALRWLGAQVWRATRRVERNRLSLYGGATGLRIVTFHGTPLTTLDQLRRVVDWWRERSPMATPSDVDDLVAGRWRAGPRDRLLVTFDDGLASNHAAAEWLADAGVLAVFFVVPSLLDRTIGQFLRFHEGQGVKAFPPVPDEGVRGLSVSQVREMLSMGHRIGAHNYAHRDLGALRAVADLRYEIGQALDALSELTSAECQDFAIGFGQPHNVSMEAAAYLVQRCPRVYSCHRGLNVPGQTPRFLLRHAAGSGHPQAFTRVCLEGGADHRLFSRVREMVRRVGTLPASRGETA